MSTPMATPRTKQTSEVVQLFRFLAAALVLITHSTFYYSERIDAGFPVWHFGEIGVPIFFVISGFVMVLITSGSDARGNSAAVAFMEKRLIRIVPLYWMATVLKIVAAILISDQVLHNHFSYELAIKSLFFIPVLNAAGEVRPIHGVGWTLYHEMFFYLIFSAALTVRVNPIAVVVTTIGLLVASGPFLDTRDPFAQVITNPINLCFLYGCVFGGFAVYSRREWWPVAICSTVVGAGILMSMKAVPRVPAYPGWSVLIFALACACLYSVPLPRFLKIGASLGGSSYALYLFHPFLAPALIRAFSKITPSASGIVVVAVEVCVVIIICHAIHVFVERPVLKFLQLRVSQFRTTERVSA